MNKTNKRINNHAHIIRIIPRLDIKGPNVVKGIYFEGLRIVGSPKELALKYYKDGADEILYMDIVASLYQRDFDFEQLKKVTSGIFIPVTVGGGIRSIEDINKALRAGADKVAMNTYALRHPQILSNAVKKFGSQCIMLSVEAKRKIDGSWEAYTDGGREKSGKDVMTWIKQAISLGIGEILISSIDMDGTRKGYDLELIKKVASFSTVPVIAHGGVGTLDSIFEAIVNGGADAISAATVFHYRDFPIQEVKNFLKKKGLNVRFL